jgi:hypothetical protein
VGLLTFALVLALEVFREPLRPLVPLVRVFSVPLWLMRTLQMLVGIDSWPGPLQVVVALPLLFLPYVAADLLLQRARRRWRTHHTAAV